MLETALYIALAVAACSALAGSRTAWILLASVAFCLALDQWGVPFNPVLWMLFDSVVVLLIVRPKMTHADCTVLALFIPAWLLYQMPDEQRYVGSMLVTIAQLVCSVEPAKIYSAPARYRAWLASDNKFDRLVAHVRLAGV